MAQTVATQRGTTTANYNSQTTLFTQSGGNSTRVILNQVTWYHAAYTSYSKVYLLHVSSSGPVTVIGYYQSSSTNYSGQMMPNPNGTGPTQTIGFSSGYGYTNGLWAGNSSNLDWPGKNAVGWFLSTSGYSYMPQNYWIGPGDSIAFSQSSDSGSNSATVGYHFTTITES